MYRSRPYVPAVCALALVLAFLSALLGIWDHDAPVTEAGTDPEAMDAMSVDVNTSGNTATSLGPNNTCVSITAGSSITVDVTALNIPSSSAIIGFTYYLSYDSGAVSVTGGDYNFMLTAAAGSSLISISEAFPDEDGEFQASVADLGDAQTSAEFGSGVLDRLTLTIDPTADGVYPLSITSANHLDFMNVVHLPNGLNNALLAIGEPCPLAGDVDCTTAVNAVDALKVLRYNALLSVIQTQPCVPMGQTLANGELQGDVDCSNTVNAVDALKLLRYGASLLVSQNEPPPCPDIGT